MLGDPDYRYVVPSAPGKRFDGDEKVTDLLYRCHRLVERNQSRTRPLFPRSWTAIWSIVSELGWT